MKATQVSILVLLFIVSHSAHGANSLVGGFSKMRQAREGVIIEGNSDVDAKHQDPKSVISKYLETEKPHALAEQMSAIAIKSEEGTGTLDGTSSTWNSCWAANWWGSFDWSGWSTCWDSRSILTGFYRNGADAWWDRIWLLEMGHCCDSNFGGLQFYHMSLTQNAQWWECPKGYYITGFSRTGWIWNWDTNFLSNINQMQCARPTTSPKKYESCQEIDVSSTWSNYNWRWTLCPSGTYLAAIYRSDCNYLRCWTKFRCCHIAPRDCLTNNGGCDKLTVCTDTDDGHTCGPCPSGWSGNGDKACVDIDECRSGNGGCDALTQCVNSPGSFSCTNCPVGYVDQPGNKPCEDVNECNSGNGGCDMLTACTNTRGSRVCSDCPVGYTGNGAKPCVDVDECQTNNGGCDPQSSCINVPGSRKCGECKKGFSGSGETRCIDIDECAGENGNCHPLTQCFNTPGSRKCGDCPKGYKGNGETGCADVDECAAGNNGGCHPMSECTNTVGSYVCGACRAGFTGNGYIGCQDVNECLNQNGGCHAQAKCKNTPGSRECGPCNPGYTGDGMSCVDIDECGTNNGGCDPVTQCINTIGSRKCGGCPRGYTGSGNDGCSDVDECKLVPNGGCDTLVQCTNTPGSRTCGRCPTGMIGDGAIRCVNDTAYANHLMAEFRYRATEAEVQAKIKAELQEISDKYKKQAEQAELVGLVSPMGITDEQLTDVARTVASSVYSQYITLQAQRAAAAAAAAPAAAGGGAAAATAAPAAR